MTTIKYRSGYKYQLAEDYFHVLPSSFDEMPAFDHDYLKFHPSILLIRKGYAWDGASGPAIDTENIMRASLVHDALYQCMRLKHLSIDAKEACDKELERICLEDGMINFRAWYIEVGVKLFGYNSSTVPRKIESAP